MSYFYNFFPRSNFLSYQSYLLFRDRKKTIERRRELEVRVRDKDTYIEREAERYIEKEIA